ncbi:hypothetical protein [Larkinella sp.]|uniref:hypothetical protein n=1 Tax=Larkinella sp. TaxID=2034517 RepID=UPI003BABE437
MNFKVKVYLSPSKEVRVIDGVHFVAYLTRWTFAETDRRTEHWRNNDKESDPLCSYTYQAANYVDGSSWTLSEIDSCIGIEDVEIIGRYEIFERDIKALPIYDTKPISQRYHGGSPDYFEPADAAARFPLSYLWGGAVIDGRKYLIDERSGGLKSVTLGRASHLFAQPENDKAAEDGKFNETQAKNTNTFIGFATKQVSASVG